MTTRFHPAVIAPTACGSHGVYFPDLPGCTSGARLFRETAEHAARLALNCGTAHSGLLAEPVRQATAAPLPAVENIQTTLQLLDVTLGVAEKGYPVGVRGKAG